MSLLDFLPTIDNVTTAIVGAFLGWFFTRKKQKADTTTIEIDNSTKIIDQYKKALDDLPARYEEKLNHFKQMADNMAKLFEKKEEILLQEIEYHKKTAALNKKMYDDKVKEFNKYKKDHP